MASHGSRVPYFSQWESRELTTDVLTRGAAAALADDPNWAASGARDIAEYVRWASNVCGMACLKMILAARTGSVLPTLELARKCTGYGGYTIAETGEIKGLIYAPFVAFLRQEYAIESEIVTGADAGEIPGLLNDNEYFIASVHPSIRWPDQPPPAKGGHLVLVLGASGDEVIFHNPSGHTPATQEYAALDAVTFDRFFAGRGIAIRRLAGLPA